MELLKARMQTAYHLVLKAISWSHFHYFYKLWIFMPRRRLQTTWRCWCRGKGQRYGEREKEKRGMIVNRTLSTSRVSRLWHGALQDMLFVTRPSVYFKDQGKPEKWGAQPLLHSDETSDDGSGSDKLVRRWREPHENKNTGNVSNLNFMVWGLKLFDFENFIYNKILEVLSNVDLALAFLAFKCWLSICNKWMKE